jgi:hypothetical protein
MDYFPGLGPAMNAVNPMLPSVATPVRLVDRRPPDRASRLQGTGHRSSADGPVVTAPWQGVYFGKWVGKRRDGFIEQVKDRPVGGGPKWLRSPFELTSGFIREAKDPVTH